MHQHRAQVCGIGAVASVPWHSIAGLVLKLAACSFNNDGPFPGWSAGLLSVIRCKELQSLKLGFCGEVTDAVLGALGANCKKLKDLDLYW